MNLSGRSLARAGVAAAVLAGVVLRFASTSPLWLDEALSVNIAKLSRPELLEALRHDGHPPLYYLLLHGWIELFGDGDVAVRALSGLFAVAALPLAWVAGRRLSGASGARWAVVVLALSPFAIRFGTEARMYSLVMLIVLAGYLLLGDALEAPTPARLAGLVLLSGALLLTHYWGFWLLGAVGLVLLLHTWRGQPDQRAPVLRSAIALAAGGVLFLPWADGFLYQAAHTGTPWASPARPTAGLLTALSAFGGVDGGAEATLLGMGLLVLALIGLFALPSTSHNEVALQLRTLPTVRWELAVAALTFLIGISAGIATKSAFAGRYASAVLPLFLLAAAVGLVRLPAPWPRAVAGISVLGLCLVGDVQNVITARTQAEVVAKPVRVEGTAGDVVAVCPDQLGPGLARALGDAPVDTVTFPDLAPPERVDWIDYADRNRAADPDAFADRVIERAGDHTIWLAWSGSYRTLEGKCEGVVNALLRARPAGGPVVDEKADDYFEHATLFRFPAP